jgi:hypothetical protein
MTLANRFLDVQMSRPFFTLILLGVVLFLVLFATISLLRYHRSRKRVIPHPFNEETIIKSRGVINTPPVMLKDPSPATMLHEHGDMKSHRKRVRIVIRQTVDPSQIREQVVDLPVVIGREDAGFTISSDRRISRRHAEVIIQNDKFFIKDLSSVNGTRVGEILLERGGKTDFTGSTLVRLGNTILEIEPLD